MAASAVLSTPSLQLKQNDALQNLGTGIRQVDLLINFVDQPNRQVITDVVHQTFNELKSLEVGLLGKKLTDLANLPVGKEISQQLKADLPDMLHSLKLSLTKRQFVTTDKSMAELAVLQARQVKEAWAEIKSSRQLTARSTAKIISIEGRLKVMEDEYCVKIRKLLSASESEKFNETQKKTIVNKMKTLYISLRLEYIAVTTDINTLKLDIDGQMIRLDHQNQQQTDLIMQNLVVNVAGAVNDVYNENWSAAGEKAINGSVSMLESTLAKLAISKEKDKLVALLDQVAVIEACLAEVAIVKKQAEAFLNDNGVDPATL